MPVTPNELFQEVSIPASSQPAYDAIVSLTDKFCQARNGVIPFLPEKRPVPPAGADQDESDIGKVERR